MARTPQTSPTLIARRAGRVRPLVPGWRPLLGGLLISLAMSGAWVAGAPRTTRRSHSYLVARGDLQPGHVLTAADVRVVRLTLPRSVAGHVLAPGGATSGSVLLGPVHDGDPIARSSVLPARRVPASHEVSVAVERPWAVDGSLVVGDRIDVLVTYGQGLESQTRRVLHGVPVVGLTEGDRGAGGLGGSADQTLTLAIADSEAVLAVVNAARAGTVTVVRATGAPPGGTDGPYRPPGRAVGTPARRDGGS